jgi:two-component system chemotaxis response regulator CheY
MRSGMVIAVVDDSRAIHAFIDEAFHGTGITLHHFYDGGEIIDALSWGKTDFNLLLLDWEMPNVSGIEALPKIKALAANLKVVMMTSKNSMSNIVEAIEKGATDYLMKPFTKEILMGKLAQVSGSEVKS